MSLRRRLRILYAALFQSWHMHHCGCGQSWYCCAPKRCDTSDMCVDCEARQLDAWMRQQMRQPTAKGVM